MQLSRTELKVAADKGAESLGYSDNTEGMQITVRATTAIYVICAVAAGMVVIPKSPRLAHAFGVPGAVAVTLLTASVLLPLIYPFLLRFHRILGPAAGVGMMFAIAVVQPKVVAANMRNTKSGSDQGECIVVGTRRLFLGEWPYDRSAMSKHNPMSCGPGELIAHAPVSFVPYSIAALLLLTGSLIIVGIVHGRATVSKMLLLLALSPVTWLVLVDGGDFLTFGVCTAALTAAAGSTSRVLRGVAIPASILLANFRFLFLCLPAAIFLRRTPEGRPSGVWIATATTAISLAVWGLFYVLNPTSFVDVGPMHVVHKFGYMIGFEINPILAVAAVSVVSGLLAVLFSRCDVITGTLFFCAVIVIPIAVANAYQMTRQSDAQWEGAGWLEALIALAAFAIAARQGVSQSMSPKKHRRSDACAQVVANQDVLK
jgi:hypothetical protein